jgi:excisionase family DNA binding protein
MPRPSAVPSADPLSAEILTPKDVAKILHVTPDWVREKCRARASNPLPVLRLGKYIRFRRTDVLAWLDSTAAPKKRGAR